MDSILAARLRAFLVSLLKNSSPPGLATVPINIIYDQPTISAMTDFVLFSIQPQPTGAKPPAEPDIRNRVRECVSRHTIDFTKNRTIKLSRKEKTGSCIVLSGTTGSLGSFLMDTLLNEPKVDRLFCLNRKADTSASSRQLASFCERGLCTSKLRAAIQEGKIIFMDVDLADRKLGLNDAEYNAVSFSHEQLLSSLTPLP